MMKELLGTLFVLVSLSSSSMASSRLGDAMNRADGLLDFVMLLTGHAKPDVAPIEKATTGAGRIATARAVPDDRGVSVRGSVKKQWGYSHVAAATSHVDVLVLNSQRRVIHAATTRFFPSPIPNNYRGTEGRSRYSAHLSKRPPVGAIIRVVFHQRPEQQCEFYKPRAG